MNTITKTNLFSGAISKGSMLALLCSSAAVYGVTPESASLTPPVPPVTEAEESVLGSAISMSLALDFNSHFISYGVDVWGGGTDWKRLIFNPSVSISVDITDDIYVFAGLWMDVNSYSSSSTIGGSTKVQEVDVWVGAGYTWEDFNFEVTYQEWMYGGSNERSIDVAISYDWVISPYVLIHTRVDPVPGQDRGTVVVVGGSYTWSYEGLDVTVPVAVGLAPKGYYGGAEGGFGYVTTGVSLSYPLSFISEAYGNWNVHGGINYYYTNNKVIDNPKDSFVTGTFGIGLDF